MIGPAANALLTHRSRRVRGERGAPLALIRMALTMTGYPATAAGPVRHLALGDSYAIEAVAALG